MLTKQQRLALCQKFHQKTVKGTDTFWDMVEYLRYTSIADREEARAQSFSV